VHRRYLGAVSATTGVPVDGFDGAADARVRALTVSPDGSKVYAGGDFNEIGGHGRDGAAELDAVTGEPTDFDPNDGGTVLAVELSPDGSHFYFSTTSNRTFDYVPSGNSPLWTLRTGGDVQAIAASASAIYVGGHFGNFTDPDKVARDRLGAVDPADGTALDWAPGMNSFFGTWALDIAADALLVGGDFTRTGGRDQRHFARYTGTP
jgi:hypothetical protein